MMIKEKSQSRTVNRRALISAIVSAASILVVVAFDAAHVVNRPLAFTFASASSAVALYFSFRMLPGRPITVLSVIVLLFCLFHFGLVLPEVLGIVVGPLSPEGIDWFRSELATQAVGTAVMGLWGLVLGGSLMSLHEPVSLADRDSRTAEATNPDAMSKPNPWPGHVGVVVLASGVLLWLYEALIVGGVNLAEGYGEFRAATVGGSLPLAYLLIALGMPFLAASPHKRLRTLGLVVFGVYALVALAVGARTGTFVPVLGYLVVRARMGHISLSIIKVAAGVGMLSLISVIRQVRATGLGSFVSGETVFSPISGLAELGASIRPVVMARLWHDEQGEGFFGLYTYYGPVQRSVIGEMLGLSGVPTDKDPSVLSTAVTERIGPIGGSQVAEAYRAGGVLAVLIVMVVIGGCMAWLDRRSTTEIWSAVVGAVGAVVFVWARNDVTPVPFDLVVIGFLAGLCWVLNTASAGKPRRRGASRPKDDVFT